MLPNQQIDTFYAAGFFGPLEKKTKTKISSVEKIIQNSSKRLIKIGRRINKYGLNLAIFLNFPVKNSMIQGKIHDKNPRFRESKQHVKEKACYTDFDWIFTTSFPALVALE